MATVPVFDYDATLVTDHHTPKKESVLRLITSIRDMYKCPLIILTAGSVNELRNPGIKYSSRDAKRPYEFFHDECNLNVSINSINLSADVCIFGVVMVESLDELKDHKCTYRVMFGNVYSPYYTFGNYTYPILDKDRVKKLSVMYHILNDKMLVSDIIFVDDMYYHDMSGLDNVLLDPFETVHSSYYQIVPIKTNFEASDRLNTMSVAIRGNKFEEYLSDNSNNVWRRYVEYM